MLYERKAVLQDGGFISESLCVAPRYLMWNIWVKKMLVLDEKKKNKRQCKFMEMLVYLSLEWIGLHNYTFL